MADADLVWENNTTDWLADKLNEHNVADKVKQILAKAWPTSANGKPSWLSQNGLN